jgi:cob(I)alamin adenosyltransferase
MGNGKGKTTAALGLALRAIGAGLNVSIHQFLKNKDYSEIKALRGIKNVRVSQCGAGAFIIGKPTVSDRECAAKGFEAAKKDVFSKKYDVIILDEINTAMKLGLVGVDEVVDIIKQRPYSVELVLTGRSCPKKIKDAADLITEMKEIRHPYRCGIRGRRGIEY